MEYIRPPMATPTMLEREVKLRFASVEEARAAVHAAGAAPSRCRRLQEDALLDDAQETLRQRRCVLRVRVESGRSLLTFKGPVQPSPMKLREEIETVVGDGETLLRCLEQLGYAVWFRYQKYREEYALTDVVIAIDETPVGVFVELEGDEHGILEADARARTARRATSCSTRTVRSSWNIAAPTGCRRPTCSSTTRSASLVLMARSAPDRGARARRRSRHAPASPHRSRAQAVAARRRTVADRARRRLAGGRTAYATSRQPALPARDDHGAARRRRRARRARALFMGAARPRIRRRAAAGVRADVRRCGSGWSTATRWPTSRSTRWPSAHARAPMRS